MFEVIAKLLAKEAGFEVRKQAVQLLYLLLNCKFYICFAFVWSNLYFALSFRSFLLNKFQGGIA